MRRLGDHMTKRQGAVAALLGVGLIVAWAAMADEGGRLHRSFNDAAPDQNRSLEISQKAIGRKIGNHRFVDSTGVRVALDEMRGRPLVVSMIYTSCSHVCPMLTQRLRQAVAEAQRVIGADRFSVITIGFDTRNDTPIRMAAFARAQGVDLPNWRFLSGDEAAVSALATELGFTYQRSAGGYLHIAQTTIVSSNGEVYRQVYGDDFPIQVFMEPLKESVYGTVGTFLGLNGLLDRVRFLCTVYDPNRGRYRVSYAIVMTFLTGIVTLGATAIIISRVWLHSRRA
jgi:protein SCO1/2